MPRSIAHYTVLSGRATEARLAVHQGDYWCDCHGDGGNGLAQEGDWDRVSVGSQGRGLALMQHSDFSRATRFSTQLNEARYGHIFQRKFVSMNSSPV